MLCVRRIHAVCVSSLGWNVSCLLEVKPCLACWRLESFSWSCASLFSVASYMEHNLAGFYVTCHWMQCDCFSAGGFVTPILFTISWWEYFFYSKWSLLGWGYRWAVECLPSMCEEERKVHVCFYSGWTALLPRVLLWQGQNSIIRVSRQKDSVVFTKPTLPNPLL